MESIIVLSDICKQYYKQEVLNHVNMTINKGDIYGLVGKNGAGKTTLIKILFGLSKPSAGIFSVYGIQNDDRHIQSINRRMGGIVEQPAFYSYMNAYDNLKVHAILCGIHEKNKINQLLELVGLKDVGIKKVRNFSLGMKQRLGIARALLTDPDLIVLDEPTNGLDPEGILDLRNLIKQLNSKYGITFLICSHYISELEQIVNKIGILKRGKIVKEETIDKIKEEFITKIHIKVDNMSTGIELLKKRGISVIPQENELCLIEKSIDVNKVLAVLTENKISISDFYKETETLEQYVLNLISEND